jgi:hypothetical protein
VLKRLTALRRGLGRGFLRAVKAASAAQDDVLRCVLKDSRWDRQIDERAAYYARLMLATQASWEPIEFMLKGYAQDASLEYLDRRLVLEVIAQAAWRGDAAAARLLATYLPHPLLLQDIRSAVFETGGAEMVARVLGPAQLGWLDLRAPVHFPEPPVPRGESSDGLLTRLEWSGTQAPEAVHERATTQELLSYRTKAGLHGYLKVMRLLGRRGCTDLLQEATAALKRPDLKPMRRRAYLDYLERLPGTATLDLARAWLKHPTLSKAARLIFRSWAEPQDREILQDAGLAALREGDQYGLCDVVQAIDRIGSPLSIEFLAHLWEDMTYSHGRTFVVKAVGRHRHRPGTARLLEEALWDCQTGVRSEAVSLVWQPGHLQEVLSDPFEHETVREAARRAFVTGAPFSSN